jgi:ceramide glucosyltransferase
VIADSDVHVAPDYLEHLVAALQLTGAGLAPPLYPVLPASRALAARLGATQITHTLLPGVLLARMLGRRDALGATMALRRETLARVGGLLACVNHLADDNVLGRLVREAGLSVVLAATVPATTVPEASLAALWRHELRWARTNRGVAPLAFAASILIQFPLFWAGLLCTLMPNEASAWAAFAGMWALRAVCGADIERRLGAPVTPFWLAPVRDTMSVCISLVAYAGRRVAWRGRLLHNTDHRLFAGAPVTLLPGEG